MNSSEGVQSGPFEIIESQSVGWYQLMVVGFSFIALVIDGLDLQLLAFAAPAIFPEWQINAAAFAPALAASLVGMALGSSVGGALGDRFGRRPTLIGGVLLFGLGTLATALATGVLSLTILRFLCGIGFGAVIPNAMALASEWMPTRYRSQAIGVLSVGTPLGGMLGALISPWLIAAFGWRSMFVASGVITVLFVLLLIAKSPESPIYLYRNGRRRLASQLMQKAFGGRVIASWPDSDTGGRPSDIPRVSPKHLFAGEFRRTTLGLCLAFASGCFVVYALGNWLPIAQTTAGVALDRAFQGSFYYNLCAIPGALMSGAIVARIGSLKAGLLGSFVAIGALVLVGVWLDSLAQHSSWPLDPLLVSLGIVGFASAIVLSTLYALSSAAYPVSLRASGIGMAATTGRVGGIIAILAGGALLSLPAHQVMIFFVTLAALFGLTMLSLFLVDRHIRPPGAVPAA